ncbi:MAG: hypothetical protein NC548_63125 [Lachnospiraceae bacterium]|nr:hypothetical protein [Lachnospiraceae bacterium]
MLEVKNTELTVTIPMNEYKYLLDLETRVDVAVERVCNDNCIDNEDILRILGTELALQKADEIRAEEQRRHEEYLKEREKENADVQ